MKRISAAATALFAMISANAFAASQSFVSDGGITVCTTAAFPPMTSKKSEGDALPTGIDIEVADTLAKSWGAETTYTTTDFAGPLPTSAPVAAG